MNAGLGGYDIINLEIDYKPILVNDSNMPRSPCNKRDKRTKPSNELQICLNGRI